MSRTGAAPDLAIDAEARAAVRAWRALGPQALPPTRVEKVKKGERSNIFRLFGVGPDGGPVIAKKSLKKNGLFERGIYLHVLSKVPAPFLHDYGLIAETDSDDCWHFMEDAGAIKFRSDDPRQRRALARRLGLLHAQASVLPRLSDLPDRGPRLHLDYLRSGRYGLTRFLESFPMDAGTARVFGRLLDCYERLEPRWPEIEALCASSPQTFVHGDVSGRNIRLRGSQPDADPVLFDWEWAGHGSPAIDLWLLERDDAAIYQDIVKDCWPDLELETIEDLITLGGIFRSIMVMQWKSVELGKKPIDGLLPILMSYRDRLVRAMNAFGWVE